MKNALIAAVVAMVVACLALVAAEMGLRLANYPPMPPIGWKWVHSPYRNQPDTATNQMGLRGRPIEYGPDDFVVILLGDSQVEAGTRLPERMPERILENVLREELGIANARVFSVAGAGWGTDQEYVQLREYFKHYRADLVLLWFTAVNDYWENGYIDRSVQKEAGQFKPTFEIDRQGEVRPHAILPSTRLGMLVDLARARMSGLTYPNWRLQRWLGRIPPAGPATPAASAACPPTVVQQAAMFDYAADAPITVVTDEDFARNRSHFSPFGQQPSEREKYQVKVTQALLAKVAGEAEAHRARFRFFYPRRPDLDFVLSKVGCARSVAGDVAKAIDGRDLVAPLDTPQLRPYRIVFSLSGPRDIAAAQNDIHHNDKGNLLAMRGLASHLREQGLLPTSQALAPAHR